MTISESTNWPILSIAECAADEPYTTQIGPFGKALTPEEYTSTGVPLLRGVNVNKGRFHDDDFVFIPEETAERLRKFESYPGDVLLVHKGTLGKIGLMPTDRRFHRYIMGNSMLRVRCNPMKLLPTYLYYWFCSSEGQNYIFSRVSQVGVPQIQTPLKTLREAKLRVPPISVQSRITNILGTLDDKIELNRRMNATLEAMARALFQSWFVDFDPVRAKLDGRPPAALDPATAALFPSAFDETSAGHIPHGWRVGSIYEIANVIYGAPFASSLFNSEKLGKPLIRIRDLPNESPAVFTTEVHPKGYLLQPGDIAVGMDGEFRAYLWAGVESWLNQRCCVFAPKPGYSAAFVRNSIIAPLAQVEATETATTVIHLGKNDIDRFTAIIPDAPVAEAFQRQCQPWYDQIVANKQQSRTLATLRDTLLPKLLSGELRVPDAEKIVGGAT